MMCITSMQALQEAFTNTEFKAFTDQVMLRLVTLVCSCVHCIYTFRCTTDAMPLNPLMQCRECPWSWALVPL